MIAFSNQLFESGRKELAGGAAVRIQVAGTNLVAFLPSTNSVHGLIREVMALSSLNPAQPGKPPRMKGLAFRADDIFRDGNDVLYLTDRERRAIYRWSVGNRQELDGLVLKEKPLAVAWSAATRRIYVSYQNLELTQITIAGGALDTPLEVPFAKVAQTPSILATAGEFLLASDTSMQSVFEPGGLPTGSGYVSSVAQTHEWSGVLRRLYFFDSDTFPNRLYGETIEVDGKVGMVVSTPYPSAHRLRAPVRVSADGNVLLLGSGHLLDPTTLSMVGSLAREITDAAWRGQILYTLQVMESGCRVQRWSNTYAPVNSVELPGEPLRLWATPDGLLVLTLEEGQPRMSLLNEAPGVVFQSGVNRAPRDVLIDQRTFAEDLPSGAVIARLAVSDPNAEDAHHFEVRGADSAFFTVDADKLMLRQPLDYETRTNLSVVVRAFDPYGQSVEKSFQLQVLDVNEAPTGISLVPDRVLENAPVGSFVGEFSAMDPDLNDSADFVLLENANGRFRITGPTLHVAAPLSAGEDYRIRVRATDRGGLSFEQSLAVGVDAYVEPAPVEEVMLKFEGPSQVSTSRWAEAGFILSADRPLILTPGNPGDIPSRESGFLKVQPGFEALLVRHEHQWPFRVFSLALAETSMDGVTAVSFEGRKSDGTRVTQWATLDGVADGPGGADDFQRVHLRDDFSELTEFRIMCASVALDDLDCYAGAAPSRPVVRWVPFDTVSFEPGEGVDDSPPFPHTARIGVTRVGPLDTDLRVQLSLGGSAEFALDYFIEGMGVDRVGTLRAGSATAWFEIFPIADAAAEPPELAELTIELGSQYSRGEVRRVQVAIHNSAWSAWLDERWPGAAATPLVLAQADPDGNGLSNLAEFLLGREPTDPDSLHLPAFRVMQDVVELDLPRHRLAEDGMAFRLERSDDLRAWSAAGVVPTRLPSAGGPEILRYRIPYDGSGHRFFRWVPALEPASAGDTGGTSTE